VTLGLIAGGALLATVMTLAEFQLLHNTSAMTLMVLGMCKEVSAQLRRPRGTLSTRTWFACVAPETPTAGEVGHTPTPFLFV
jgi:hypothetical protein